MSKAYGISRKISLGFSLGFILLVLVPGIWVLFDSSLSAHPAAIAVYLGGALALLHWRKKEMNRFKRFLLRSSLLIGYALLLLGAYQLSGRFQFIPLLPPSMQGQILMVTVVFIDFFLLSIDELSNANRSSGRRLNRAFVFLLTNLKRLPELPFALHKLDDDLKLAIAFGATWVIFFIFSFKFIMDSSPRWPIAFAGLSSWISYLGFT